MASKRKAEALEAWAERYMGVEEDYNEIGVRVSPFDYSVENHFRAMDRISELCGEDVEEVELDESEVNQLSSSVTFLREWRLFNYEPRDVRFACELGSSKGKKVTNGINLRQFSSAAVSKKEGLCGDSSSLESRDFVMYAGGPVWGLDWCPRVREGPDSQFKCEFIAIAAHPPGSSYHKIGAPLSGRGVIQIWSLLNIGWNEGDISPVEKPKSGHKKSAIVKEKRSEVKKPRGRRKKPIKDDVIELDGNGENIEPLDTKVPKSSSNLLAIEGIPRDPQEDPVLETAFVKEKPCEAKKPRGRPRKKTIKDDIIELDGNGENIESFNTQVVKSSSNLLAIEGIPRDTQEDPVLAFVKEKTSEVKKPRGRPRKKPIKGDIFELDGNGENIEPFDTQVSKSASNLLAIEGIPRDMQEDPVLETAFVKEKTSELKKPRGRPRKKRIKDNIVESDGNGENIEPFDTQVSKSSSNLLNIEGIPRDTQEDPVLESAFAKEKPSQVKRHRGRPRKKQVNNHITELDGNSQYTEPFDSQDPKNSSNLLAMEGVSRDTQKDSVIENHVDIDNCRKLADSACNLTPDAATQTRNSNNEDDEENASNDINQLPQDEHNRSSILSQKIPGRSGGDLQLSSDVPKHGDLEISSISCPIQNDVSLPRVFLCLAHMGKVAWDVKWRPTNAYDSKCKHRMGFLAVALGDGSLQVWDVPLPRTIKALYSLSHGENTDPRFAKLKPVFRCSMLKSGGVQSIPLTLEWSPSPPHEFLLAGCHDGTVALWKFTANVSSEDTRPLLRFSAHTVPIRAVAWAPVESGTEGANVILTAGHEGLQFWDIRDPFRPLWEIHTPARNSYSLDWLPDPRCVVLSFDDGSIKTLSLSKAAYDAPVTGKPFDGTKQQGFHTYNYSSYAIWSVHVSRSTGMVAYCSADGSVLRYQLTRRAVDKDPSRNRAAVFWCGSLTMDESTITINTPTANAPFPLKPLNKGKDTPIALRDVLSMSNKAKRSNDKMEKHAASSNDQTLALCCGDDPEAESEPEETLASLKRKNPPTSGSSSRTNLEENLALVAVDDEPRNTQGKEIEKVGKYEVLPSKDVAVHRVRWNMNKGSERWLCHGGVAGIVRCQEIVLSDIDEKLAKKK